MFFSTLSLYSSLSASLFQSQFEGSFLLSSFVFSSFHAVSHLICSLISTFFFQSAILNYLSLYENSLHPTFTIVNEMPKNYCTVQSMAYFTRMYFIGDKNLNKHPFTKSVCFIWWLTFYQSNPLK